MILFKLKQVLRSILRSGVFALVNVIGLSITICAIAAIYIYSHSELSTDKQFTSGNTIFRIFRNVEESNSSYQTPTLSAPFREILKEETAVDQNDVLRVYQDDELISHGKSVFFESNVLYVDANFFTFFDHTLEVGNPDQALETLNAVVISSSIASKYFGDQNPIGEILQLEGKGRLEVTGVLADKQVKSHLPIDFLVNNAAMGYTKKIMSSIDSHSMAFYLKVSPAQEVNVKSDLKFLSEKYLNKEENAPRQSMHLQALSEVYFDKPMVFDIAKHGNKNLLHTLLAIGMVLAFLMCANFINLIIAKLTKGVKQIGLKKVLGSSRKLLFLDWTLEVFVTICMATSIGIALSFWVLPIFIDYYGLQVTFPNYTTVFAYALLFTVILTLVITTVPGLIFSSVRSFSALSGKIGNVKTSFVQYGLLMLQFVAGLVLIVFTIVINQQFQYMQNKEVGIDSDQVLIFNSNNRHSWKNRERIKNEIAQLNGVKDISMIYGGLPTSSTEAFSYKFEDVVYQWNTAFAQPNLISLLDLKVLDGESFDHEKDTEVQQSVLLNETSAKSLGWPQTDIIGKKVTLTEESTSKRILGVVEDYHYTSFRTQIEPLVIQSSGWEETFVVKLEGKSYQNALASIESIWQKYVPKYPFGYHFLDDTFHRMHREDVKQGKIILFFTLLTLIIASIGTLSLSAFIQQLKVKEIAIRKVLGAPFTKVFIALSSNLLRTLLISGLVAVPIAWLLVRGWLEDFSYRVDLTPLAFVMAYAILITTVLVLLITQSWKSVHRNPVESLQSE